MISKRSDKRRHFLQLCGDQQHRTAGIAQGHQLAMNEFDRADVNTTRRLRNQQELRIAA